MGVVPGAVYLLFFYMADLYGDNLRRDKLLMKLEIKTITKQSLAQMIRHYLLLTGGGIVGVSVCYIIGWFYLGSLDYLTYIGTVSSVFIANSLIAMYVVYMYLSQEESRDDISQDV